MREITIKQLYQELEENPDLRRLGPYKITFEGGRPIFPIVFEADEIHLGEGDFTGAFTALDKTKARVLDFGSSTFTDLYLDYLEAETVRFSSSKASRVYFDYAKAGTCEFNELEAPEIYFDEAELGTVNMQELKAGILHLDKVKAREVVHEGELAQEYRFAVEAGGTKEFGNFTYKEEQAEGKENAIELTLTEFLSELKTNPDLRRLGAYRVTPEREGEKALLNFDGGDVYFGNGDLSALPVSLGSSSAGKVNLGSSVFAELDLGALKAEELDLGRAQAAWLNFESAQIEWCYFSNFYGHRINGGKAELKYLFGEHASSPSISLDELSAEQISTNELTAGELRLGKSRIGEMYMSRGKGIEKLLCEESTLELLNLHEAELGEIHFDKSAIKKALINKSSIQNVYCDELNAELLYLGNYKNEFGLVDFGEMKGISHIEAGEILPQAEGEQRRVFKTLKFGPDVDEELKKEKKPGEFESLDGQRFR